MTQTRNTPTPAALRAAKEIATRRRTDFLTTEAIADIIDRETGLAEMIEALEWAEAVLDGYGPPLDAEPREKFYRGFAKLRVCISRHKGGRV